MPRKRLHPQSPTVPRVEFVPMEWDKLTASYTCYLCERSLGNYCLDPHVVVAVCCVVLADEPGRVQRRELGCLCEHCLQALLQETPQAFAARVRSLMHHHEQRITQLSMLVNYPVGMPSEAAWLTAEAECLASTRQTLRDLQRATGLSAEEIVHRLLTRARPEDL
jgi:hypothetical protein